MKNATTFIIITLTCFLFSCDNKVQTQPPKKDIFFYLTDRSFGRIDTSEYSGGNSSIKGDKLIYGKNFSFKNKIHAISLYLIDGPAIDDEGLEHILDSVGVFYSKSLVWPGHTALITNNDSINEIIDAAKNQILADPNLHCYQCRRYDKSPGIIQITK